MDLKAFSERIGYDCVGVGASRAVLDGVVRGVLLAVPFEQLDVALGRGINIDPDVVFAKLVTHRRGGYCFEVNILVREALRAMGYSVEERMARVLIGGGVTGFTHFVLVVTIDDARYLVDCGFGASSPRVPVPLASITDDGSDVPIDGAPRRTGRPVLAYPDALRLVADNGVHVPSGGWRLQSFSSRHWERGEDDEECWRDMYVFHTEGPVYPADVELGNHWVSTRLEDNFFTNTRLAVLFTPDGVVISEGDRLMKRQRQAQGDLAALFGPLAASTLPADATPCYASDAATHAPEDYLATLAAEFGLDLTWDHRVRRRVDVCLASFTAPAMAQNVSFLRD